MIHILCYHRVLPEPTPESHIYWRRGTVVSCEHFRAQLERLTKTHIMLEEAAALDWLESDTPWPYKRPGAWITFDDGYMDNLVHAAPITSDLDIRPSLFISTGILEPRWRFPVDRWYDALNAARQTRGALSFEGLEPWRFDLARPGDLARLIDGPEKRRFIRASRAQQRHMLHHLHDVLDVNPDEIRAPRYLDAEALRNLGARGWKIGCHARWHTLLTNVSGDEVCDEVTHSQQTIDALLPTQHRSRCFAYPDGAWDTIARERIERVGRALKWRAALSIDAGPVTQASDLWALPRYIAQNTPAGIPLLKART